MTSHIFQEHTVVSGGRVNSNSVFFKCKNPLQISYKLIVLIFATKLLKIAVFL